jgi:D-hydroxyproline dehydrogenase subunit alpha
MNYDVIVVGAGPGGIAAATVVAEAGKCVCLLDDNLSPGGQVWRGFRADTAENFPHRREFLQWLDRLRRTNCEVVSGWRATDCPAPGVLRLDRDGESRDIAFRKLILATGARERFLPFPGWTLPGVTGAGGLQALAKSGLDLRGQRVVVAGTGPLLLAIAAGLADAGAIIAGIYEQAPLSRLIRFGFTLVAHPDKLLEGARCRRKLRGVTYRTNSWIVRAEGRDRVERVAFTDGRKQWSHDCEWLACGFHLVPNLELPHLLGCEIRGGYVSVDLLQQSSVPGVSCIGELTGIGGLEKALLEGQIAGWAAADCESEARSLASHIDRLRRFGQRLDIAFALRDELRALPEPETIVCRCEDVPYGELRECRTFREAKLHARCGMGACQGRICGTATEFLFGWKQANARPPVYPAAVSVVSAEAGPTDSRIL